MAHIIGAGREIAADYNEIFYHEEDDARVAKLDMWIAKNVGEHLVKTYPRRRWEIEVDSRGRFLIIKAPSLSMTHGYHLDMKLDTITEVCRRSVIAAGEILERYGLSRAKLVDPDNMEDFDRDLRDNVIPISNSMLGENPLKGK